MSLLIAAYGNVSILHTVYTSFHPAHSLHRIYTKRAACSGYVETRMDVEIEVKAQSFMGFRQIEMCIEN